MGEAERIESAVRSFEDRLSADLGRLDAWLAEEYRIRLRIRAELAQRLHTLRMAENRPYEDAADADELARRLRDVAPR